MADETIKTLAVEIAMSDGSFQQGVKNLKQQLSMIDTEFKASVAGVNQWGTRLDSLKSNAIALGDKINVQKQFIQQYTDQLKKSEAVLEANAQKMLDLKAKVEAAKNAWEQSKSALGKNAEATKQLEAEYIRLSKQYESAEGLVRKNNSSVQGYIIQLNNAKGALRGMESELQKVNEEINLQASRWKKISVSLEEVSEKLKGIGEKFTSAGRTLSTAVTAPIVAAGVASSKLASDMNESLNKVDVAFGENAQEVKDWSKTALKSFGLAQGSALDAAALYGDMGTAMGQSTIEAAKMSTSLVGLAGDMASFKNISMEQASEALRGIYTGEGESLKTLGVIMQDSTLEAYALATGQQKSYDEMSQAEKVALRYAFVMEATKNSQGDFARTSEGTANQTRMFGESLKELGTSFGQYILPVITPFIARLNDLIQSFGQLSEGTKKTILVVAGIAAVIGPVILGVGGLITAISSIAGAIATVSGAVAVAGGLIAVITGPIGIVVGVIAGLVAVGVLLYKNWDTLKAKGQELWNGLQQTFINAGAFFTNTRSIVVNNAKNAWKDLGGYYFNIWTDIKTGASIVWKGIGDFLSQTWTGIKGTAMTAWNGIKNGVVDAFKWMYNHNYYFQNLVDFISQAWDSIKNGVRTAWNAIQQLLISIWDGIVSRATEVWKRNVAFYTGIWEAISGAAQIAWTAIKELLEGLWVGIVNAMTNIFPPIVNFLSGVWNSVFGTISSVWNNIWTTISSLARKAFDSVKTIFGGLSGWFSDLANEAWDWGANLVNSIANGIWAMAGKVADAAQGIANRIASFLGFHSPTEEGPGSKADQWMPNLMKMLTTGIQAGTPKLQAQLNSVLTATKLSGLNLNAIPSNVLMATEGGGSTMKSSNSYGSILHVEKLVIANDMDIRELANKLGFYYLQTAAAKGGK